MGSFTPSLVVPRVAVCEPSSFRRIAPPRVHVARPEATTEVCPRVPPGSVRARAAFSRRTHAGSVASSNGTTIASMMLAPCSASSMLSASLRPGRWPGLRALTTPARGTHWQLRDDGHLMTVHNDVDANSTRAYGGLITSVPHGTPPVRPNGIRSAHSADCPKGTVWSASLTLSQPIAGPPRAVGLHTAGCELQCLSRRRVLRTTRRNEAALTKA
jgi:hypothetical protein